MESLDNAPFKRLMEKRRKLSFSSSESDSSNQEENKSELRSDNDVSDVHNKELSNSQNLDNQGNFK